MAVTLYFYEPTGPQEAHYFLSRLELNHLTEYNVDSFCLSKVESMATGCRYIMLKESDNLLQISEKNTRLP